MTKKSQNDKIKVHCYPAIRSPACFFYRIYSPLSWVGDLKHDEFYCTMSPKPDQQMIDNADIVIFQRAGFPHDLYLLEQLLKLDKKIVYEVDDNLLNLPPNNPHYKTYSKKEIKETIRKFISTAHAVTVPTLPLKEFFSSLNNNIHLIPNAVDFRLISPRARNNNKIVVGYQGAIEHKSEFKLISKCLDALTKKDFKDRVHVKLFGFKHSGCQTVKYFPFERFHEALMLADLDIGLAPLAQNQFNEGKSNLKWLEYSAFETATIATDIYPYSNSIEEGFDGFLIKHPKDWIEIIKQLVSNSDKLREVQENAFNTVKTEFNVQNTCLLWYDLLKSLRKDR